jgi:hypothetical protein
MGLATPNYASQRRFTEFAMTKTAIIIHHIRQRLKDPVQINFPATFPIKLR